MNKIKAYESKDIKEIIEKNDIAYFQSNYEYTIYMDIKEFLNYFSKRYNKILTHIFKQDKISIEELFEIDKQLPELTFTYYKENGENYSANKYFAFSSYLSSKINMDKKVTIREWKEVENFLDELSNVLLFFKNPLDNGMTLKRIKENPLKVPKNLKSYFKY